jgi:hypothetical protein
MKASLSHLASRLLHCEREAFLKRSSRQKYFFLDSVTHASMLDTEKNTGREHIQGDCNYDQI